MSIIDSAVSELRLAKFSEREISAYTKILKIFFEEWDSGGAVWAAAPVLQRLIAGKCLTPLTGEPDEWIDHGSGVFQNIRCGSVFKDPRFHDGKLAYDIDAKEPRAAISFPYWPERGDVSSPVIEI